jgi:cell division GTPase FtsZ
VSINLKRLDISELRPRITIFGVGGAGGNAVNNMINAGLQGVDFVVANTDAQALAMTRAERIIQMGVQATEGLGAGSPRRPRTRHPHRRRRHQAVPLRGPAPDAARRIRHRGAEAAIANPLIYDVSMRGARGLLISITGGKDLTLFEVDEAATRIREEVDADANIIVGATFDESLDGIIRVSVVATGVDINPINNFRPATSSQPSAPPQARVAVPTPSTTMPGPRANLAVEARSADIHEALIAELAQQLKAENARNTERTKMLETPAQRVAHRG